MKQILLIGANFRNKGAEAMALTAVRYLSRKYPSAKLIIASYAKKESVSYGEHDLHDRIAGRCSYRVLRNKKNFFSVMRILCAGIFPLPVMQKLLCKGDTYLSAFSESDLIIDYSGFALTDKRPLSRRLVYCLEIFTSKVFHKPFVVFTQALGPFEKFLSHSLARHFLSQVNIVFSRGEGTTTYLEGLKLPSHVRVERCADSAYLFEADPPEVGRALLQKTSQGLPLFGLVPNINIYQRRKPRGSENPYIVFFAQLCDFVREELKAVPVIICHERYENREDDEWLASEVVRRSQRGSDIRIVSAEHSAATLKATIGELDFLVASRFHSLVAAISLAVPCLAVGWAHKYTELLGEAGIEENVFQSDDLNGEALFAKLRHAWEVRQDIHQRLLAVVPQLKKSAEFAYDVLAETFPNEKSEIL